MLRVHPPLRLDHLEGDGIRARMLADWTEEVEDLVTRRAAKTQWPYGRDVTVAGWDHFLEAMPAALRDMDRGWLAATMKDRRLWNPTRMQMRKRGPYPLTINIPDAAVKLCYTEFSTAYTMAVAGLALEQGIATCEVYRAGEAAKPRASCTHLEGPGDQLPRDPGGASKVSRPVCGDCHSSGGKPSSLDTDSGVVDCVVRRLQITLCDVEANNS